MNKLEIENLSKIYGKKVANDKITVTLENGVYGLLEIQMEQENLH